MLRPAVLLALAAVLLAVPACARGGDDDATTTASVPPKRDLTRDMHYEVKAVGDIDFAIDKTAKVRVLALRNDNPDAAAATLLSVGAAEPVATDDGRKLRVAFDLTRFKGNGSYRIHAGSPRELVQQAQQSGASAASLDQSNVLVQLWGAGVDPTAQLPEVFDYAVEPCTLDVSKDGDVGKLTCPKVTNDGGKVFTLEMRWAPK